MVAYSDYAARALLDWTTGKASAPATAARYLALFTAVGVDAGTGFTEVSGGSYARQQIPTASWPTASGSSPSSTSTTSGVSFPTSTADWTGGGATPVLAWALYDALTAGNLVAWDYLGNFPWLPFVGSLASPSLITVPAHGFSNGDQVAFTAEFGGVLPGGGNFAGLKTVAGAATDTFNVGVNATSSGSGSVRKVAAQVVPNNTTVTFGAGNLTIQLA